MKEKEDNLPSEEAIRERFVGIVAKSLKVDPATVTPDAQLDSLGADSLDLLEIGYETDEAFNISLPERSILKTAEEIFGHDVLTKNGMLTNVGRDLLLLRMPELKQRLTAGTMTVEDLDREFLRISVWVRMIRGLMEHTPQECAKCGAGLKRTTTGSLKCEKCGVEVDVPAGEDLNKAWVREQYEKLSASGALLSTGTVQD